MPRAEAEDVELMARAASGDRQAFERAVAPHLAAVARLTRAIAGGAAADDAVQETLLLAFRRASTWKPSLGGLRPWLFAIARREAWRQRAPLERHEDEATLEVLGLEAGWSAPDPEAQVQRAEDAERLAWAITALEPKDREVLLLRDVEGLSGEESAAVLGAELAAVKSRLHRARLKLMARLREGTQTVKEREREEAGMRCGDVLAVLSEYVDGTLDAAVRARVDGHLRACSVCERFGGRFSRVVSALRGGRGLEPTIFQSVLAHLR